MIGAIMKRSDFESLSIDKLWALREEITTVLGAKMLAENVCLKNA